MKDLKLAVPFRSTGYGGEIRVSVDVDHDPVQTGLELTAAIDEQTTMSGFPVARAEVSYDSSGYRAVFGWMQTITHEYEDPDEQTGIMLDRWLGLPDLPLIAFGYLPTMFKASTSATRVNMYWVAHTFLVRLALLQGEYVISGLAGFRWGYCLDSGHVTTLPLVRADSSDWGVVSSLVEPQMPGWVIPPSLASE